MRTILIGTGYWAEQHLRAYALGKKHDVVGIVGHSNESRLNELADTYNIPDRFMDVGQALAATKPDTVDIASAAAYRVEGIRCCAGTSVKLVNMEKPMALLPSDAYEIERLCTENNLLLTVNHQKKFNAPWARAQAIIAGGELGKITSFRATCKGNMLEQGTHVVDMLLFFQGYTGVRWVMGQVADLEGLGKEKTPAPDSAVGVIEFDNGVQATLTLGNVGWPVPNETEKWFHVAIEAYGTGGHLSISLNQALSVSIDGSKTTVEDSSWEDTYLQGIADHLDAAARYAADPGQGHVSCLENSMLSFQVIMAIYASACGAGRVEFPCRFEDDVVTNLRKRG